ncbi:hypothetical protein DPMN_029233 [Dreissena polymorpha]|uniref:Uncharacterized protein n=1 Tax=Dreissena polymorpha TaxID=45954 RepID=A0A9D4RF30_DREPO|nr:hypothetical protein DPMN_029233 [Dreissena polymorpha]
MNIKEHKMVFMALVVFIVIGFSLSQMNLDVYVSNAFKTKATNTAESGNYLISGKGKRQGEEGTIATVTV